MNCKDKSFCVDFEGLFCIAHFLANEYSPTAHARHSFAVVPWVTFTYVRTGHNSHLSYAVGTRLYPSAQYCPKDRAILAWRVVY